MVRVCKQASPQREGLAYFGCQSSVLGFHLQEVMGIVIKI